MKDYTNHKFNSFTVLSNTMKQKRNGSYIWLSECVCGEKVEIETDTIRAEDKQSCGCKRFKDWTGFKLNNFKVINLSHIAKNKQRVWNSECSCGNTFKIRNDALVKGEQIGCGCSHPNKFGENNGAWKGGTSLEKRNGKPSKKWCKSILKRDNYTCQKCNCYGGNNKFNAHHLKSYALNKGIRWDLDNGVTLCTKCHKEFHKTYGYHNFTSDNYYEYINKQIAA